MSTVPSSDDINSQASVLMKQGIRLLDAGSPAEALPFFERALELRKQLPASNPTNAFGLAACWLNRGDALSRKGDAESIAEAIRSYDAGISALQTVPLDTDPRFPRRLAIGHQNRGLLLLSQGRVDAAIADLHTAIGVLEQPDSAAIDDRQYLLAAVWLNIATRAGDRAERDCSWPRAMPRSAPSTLSLASKAATRVRGSGTASASRDLPDMIDDMARTAARTRRCLTTCTRATDVVDEGLALAREWERQGDARFRAAGVRLVAIWRARLRNPSAAASRRIHQREHRPVAVVARLRLERRDSIGG